MSIAYTLPDGSITDRDGYEDYLDATEARHGDQAKWANTCLRLVLAGVAR